MTAVLKADELKALAARSDRLGLLQLAGHLLALCATGALLWQVRASLWAVPAVFLHGYVLVFLFCALHEATHGTPFRSRWLNDLVGHFCGFLLLLPFGYFRLFHWDHHRFTQDPARDPELSRPKPATLAEYLLHVSGFPNWYSRLLTVLGHAVKGRTAQPWVAQEASGRVVREARFYLLGYVALGVGSAWMHSWALVLLWILPAMAGQLFLRNYLLAEHTGCGEDQDPLSNTRTTYTNRVVRFFAWNMPYHVEHHAYPAVPFHALARLNRRIGPHIVNPAPGYVAAVRTIVRPLISKTRPTAAASRS